MMQWTNKYGKGMLTDEGVAQHAKVGAAMRERYLPANSTYDRDFVHVRSSDFDRTLLSAQSQLRAMWNVAIPIHTVASPDEILLRGVDSRICPVLVPINPTVLIDGEKYNADLEGDDIIVARVHGFLEKLKYTKVIARSRKYLRQEEIFG